MSHSEHTASNGHNTPSSVTASHTVTGVHPGMSALSSPREYKFSFKKQTITTEAGQEIKRPPVILNVPIPTLDGLVHSMGESPKVVEFVLELVEEAVKDQIRSQLSDEEKPVNRQEDLDLTKLTLEYIANLPKSERTGGGISKETWDAFEKDYTEVMVPLRTVAGDVEKARDRVAKAVTFMVGRLNRCRTDKPVLKFLREQLSLWAQETSNLEEFQDVFKYLDDRATDLLNKDNVSQLESL